MVLRKGFMKKIFQMDKADIARMNFLKERKLIPSDVGVMRFLLKHYYDIEMRKAQKEAPDLV